MFPKRELSVQRCSELLVCPRVWQWTNEKSQPPRAHDERGRGPGEVGLTEVMNYDGFQLRGEEIYSVGDATSLTGDISE